LQPFYLLQRKPPVSRFFLNGIILIFYQRCTLIANPPSADPSF